MAAATRVIFPAASREKTLMLANTNAYPVIVQTWVDKGEGDPNTASAPFVILPAVFRLLPGERQGIRIVYNQDPLPQDRESAFWINLYEIPPATEKQRRVSRITLAMNTQLKLFWRPQGVTMTPKEAANKLRFTLVAEGESWSLECDNPTPMHISFTTLGLTGALPESTVKPQADMMIRPFSQRRYALESAAGKPVGNQVRFHYLDDNGASLEHTIALQPRH
jgi:P pilus assembly chaperone PapD